MRKEKESGIVRSILDYFQLKNIFCFRNNTGAARIGESRFIRFGAKGSPDIIAVCKGIFIGIEVKAKGNYQSPDQKEFQKKLEKAGGVYILARSLDDITKHVSFL